MTPTSPRILFYVVAFALTSLGSSSVQKTEGDSPFQGNRLPGILAAPSSEPTGENAHLYRNFGRLAPDEFLDRLSQQPET